MFSLCANLAMLQ